MPSLLHAVSPVAQKAALVKYLLRDLFTTAEAAPLSSPRTCEPGPGTLTITDTNNYLDISGSALISSGSSDIGGDPGIRDKDGFARVAGRCFKVDFDHLNAGFDKLELGWSRNDTGALGTDSLFLRHAGDYFRSLTQTLLGDWTPNLNYLMADILRTGGNFLCFKQGSGDWKLVWIGTRGTTDTPMYPGINFYYHNWGANSAAVADLPAPWSDDFGLPTDELSGSLSAGQTFTHPADGRLEFTMTTLPSSGTAEFYFRYQDANNYWSVTVTSGGNLSLLETVAGSPTNRGFASGVLSGGERIVVTFDGETITGYYDGTQAWQYTSAGNFKTETSGEVQSLATGGAADDLATYILDSDVPAASGLYTDWLPGTRYDDDAYTHAADCLIEYTVDDVGTGTSGNVYLRFRQQDTDNFWYLRVEGDGTLTLFEQVAASPTSRATAAAAVSNGDRIVIIADDETINVYVNGTQQINYTSAANFKTATAGEVALVRNDARMSNIVVWDRDISSSALASLNQV